MKNRIFIQIATLFLLLVLTTSTTLAVNVEETPNLLRGDVDLDGTINSTDALLVLKNAVGLDSNIDTTLADVNIDTTINSTDALLILRISVGLEGKILYYYTDGTTGYTPKPGAKYYENYCWQFVPGNTVTDEEINEANKYCKHCGREDCLRFWINGDECPDCGVFVPVDVCHHCS